ncbi:hypothetical protein RJ640_022789 [Escallonia rubra]|uniref:Uncharacterized protein n=1 Tax=Escallonia rubra TaxID=112253 RepID=A0AA88R1Q4_9ASTE|nr:hypothetical protein RJ640_022789 [Escallonia rubra]
MVLQAGKQHISSSAWVKWVNHLAKWSSGNTVVESVLAKDLGSGLEPHRLTELDAVTGQKLREDTPESFEHCPLGVDHLNSRFSKSAVVMIADLMAAGDQLGCALLSNAAMPLR